jgi:phospholipid-binding lipoprotein MlaA
VVAAEARAQTPQDPYEKINRIVFDRTMEADKKYLRPVSQLYQSLTPGILGLAIHNFVTNLSEPVVIGNDFLQLRIRRGADDLARLVTNTTFGIGGIIDLAKRQGLPHRDNDFGITLGVWGMKPGAYLFLPFLGPSDMRDAMGMGIDSLMSPLTWARFPGHFTLEVTTTIAGAFDMRVHAQAQLDAEMAGATDPYATIRSDYLQSREAMVRGEEAAPELTPIDEPPAAPPAGGAPPPSSALDAPVQLAAAELAAPDLAADAPMATAPRGEAASAPRAGELAAADDPDLPMATAQPCDRDPVAAPTRLAGL